MKTLILAALASVAGLVALPVATAQESGPVNAVVLPPGKTFTLTVKKIVSSKSVGGNFTPSGVPIPAGIPKYKIGDRIKFTIGKGSELKWPDRTLPIYGDYGDRISYGKFPTVEKPHPDSGIIYINAKNRPTKAEIYLYKVKTSGAVHTVLYELQ